MFQHDENIVMMFNQNFLNYLENSKSENLEILNKIFKNLTLNKKLKIYQLSYDKDGPKSTELFNLIESTVKLYESDPKKIQEIGDEFYQIWLKTLDIELPEVNFKINTVKTGSKKKRKTKRSSK